MIAIRTLAACRRVASAPQDEAVAFATRDRMRTVAVVPAVQHGHARPVCVHVRLLWRRARLLVRAAAHATKEERAALESPPEAHVERHVGAGAATRTRQARLVPQQRPAWHVLSEGKCPNPNRGRVSGWGWLGGGAPVDVKVQVGVLAQLVRDYEGVVRA